MKSVVAILAILALAGCGRPEPVATADAPVEIITKLSQTDAEKLATVGLDRPLGSVVVVEKVNYKDTEKDSNIPFLRTKEFGGEIGYIRNPGVRVAILTRNADGRALNQRDREYIAKIAKAGGFEVLPEPRVIPIFGPDGTTRVIMRNGLLVDGVKKPAKITSVIAFKTKSEAEAARAYIGPGYEVSIAQEKSAAPTENPKGASEATLPDFPWMLKAEFVGLQGLLSAEMDEFERLAGTLGGSYVTTYFGG